MCAICAQNFDVAHQGPGKCAQFAHKISTSPIKARENVRNLRTKFRHDPSRSGKMCAICAQNFDIAHQGPGKSPQLRTNFGHQHLTHSPCPIPMLKFAR